MSKDVSRFSVRLTQKLMRLMVLFTFLISFVMIVALVNATTSQISSMQNVLILQIRNEILRITSYGEFIQLQPSLSNSVASVDQELRTYLSIKQVNSGSTIAYAGDESSKDAIFRVSHQESLTVPTLGTLLIESDIGYDSKVAKGMIAICFFSSLFLIILLLFKRRIQVTISAESVGVAELETVLNNLNEDTTDEEGDFAKAASMIRTVAKTQAQLIAYEKLNLMALQVSHDIRSPLSALAAIVNSLGEVPKEKRDLITRASQRIDGIANELLAKSRMPEQFDTSAPADAAVKYKNVQIVELLESLVSEKRQEFSKRSDIQIVGDFGSNKDASVAVDPIEFARIVSNLTNNSIEAVSEGGKVKISVRVYPTQVSVIVSDNGKGIPEHILEQLGTRAGISHGKAGTSSGSGLGVFHARTTIEKFGGKFSIQSRVDEGTIVMMTFPRIEHAS